jgi:hypothetical protein
MSYGQVSWHLEQIFNGCGDPVRFTPTGLRSANPVEMAVEVMKVNVLRTNDCFTLPARVPPYTHNPAGQYTVNIIHLAPALAEAYSAGHRYPDEELVRFIQTKAALFFCYQIAP